jgi:tRNA(Arg) A34 adenosine deaminase TadA
VRSCPDAFEVRNKAAALTKAQKPRAYHQTPGNLEMTSRAEGPDLEWLRRAFVLARQARTGGHRPFGAVVASPRGLISEAGSTQTADGDPTGHAEMNAVRMAMKFAPRGKLREATLYASSEPCAMCAAAIFYSGIERIVFGFSEMKLRPLRNLTIRGAGVSLSCRDVLAKAPARLAVIGPCLEDEAAEVHAGYWARTGNAGADREHPMALSSFSTDDALADRDTAFLRRTFNLAEDAGARGELPFGALVASAAGKVLIEAISTEIGDGDWTCHAETNAIRKIAALVPRDRLAASTLYASSEPCVMCASAAFYSGIRRIVFGFGEARLRLLLGAADETAGLGLSCRDVLAHALGTFEIYGPCLEEEASLPLARYWPKLSSGPTA